MYPQRKDMAVPWRPAHRRPTSPPVAYSFFSDAMSMEKRYFTSDFSIRS